MKKLTAGLLVAAVATLAGCNTSNVGGPGATTTTGPRVSGYGPADSNRGLPDAHHVPAGESPRSGAIPAVGGSDTFRLSGPAGLGTLLPSVTLKQGEKKEFTVTINRGADFKDDVKLEVVNPPKGLTVTPEKPAIGAGDKEAKVTIEAAKEAPLGTATVEIKGVAAKSGGPAADLKLEVKVEKGGESK
jgi:hypothetical protein